MGSLRGIQAQHTKRLALQLFALNRASSPEEMDLPGWDWHGLKGDLKGHWSVRVNGNWRLVYRFEGKDAVFVDYLDYH